MDDTMMHRTRSFEKNLSTMKQSKSQINFIEETLIYSNGQIAHEQTTSYVLTPKCTEDETDTSIDLRLRNCNTLIESFENDKMVNEWIKTLKSYDISDDGTTIYSQNVKHIQ